MQVDIIAAHELDRGLEDAWRGFQAADGDLRSPFFSPEFCRIVGTVCDDLRIAVLTEAGAVSGFLPYHVQRGGRLAPLAGEISDYHGIVGNSETAPDLRALLKALKAQAYDFNHVPASQARFRPHGYLDTSSPLVDLGEGFEAWRAERRAGSSAIANVERKGRKLGREVGPLRFVANETDPAVWAALDGWKRASLAAIGVRFILDRPWAGAVVAEVRATDTPGFGGMTSALWAGDTLAAVSFSMRAGTTAHSWFPTYNPDLERYSPGLTLLMELLRHADASGTTEYDLGRGDERYKGEFANAARALVEGSVERPFTPQGVARRLRKSALGLARRLGPGGAEELARRAGNRLLSAGRLR
ncbi:MAG: GNAT family N-acetyltransferase [Maritimibacter sp.]|nr:GNAT family N-acetyltransferase [Maritimibacter sp.]